MFYSRSLCVPYIIIIWKCAECDYAAFIQLVIPQRVKQTNWIKCECSFSSKGKTKPNVLLCIFSDTSRQKQRTHDLNRGLLSPTCSVPVNIINGLYKTFLISSLAFFFLLVKVSSLAKPTSFCQFFKTSMNIQKMFSRKGEKKRGELTLINICCSKNESWTSANFNRQLIMKLGNYSREFYTWFFFFKGPE